VAPEAGLGVMSASRAYCIPASSLISQPCGVSSSPACVLTTFLYGNQHVKVKSDVLGGLPVNEFKESNEGTMSTYSMRLLVARADALMIAGQTCIARVTKLRIE
jgi:hypothetical protein